MISESTFDETIHTSKAKDKKIYTTVYAALPSRDHTQDQQETRADISSWKESDAGVGVAGIHSHFSSELNLEARAWNRANSIALAGEFHRSKELMGLKSICDHAKLKLLSD